MDKQYSPEWHGDRKIEARIQQAQRVRVWTAAYAAALPAYLGLHPSIEAVSRSVKEVADMAVEMFDESWRTE